MASSSSLYGAPRPKSKNNPISLSSTSIHALSTEITLARSRLSSSNTTTTTSKTAPGRSRPSKTKSLFANSNKGVSKRAARDLAPDDDDRKYGGKTTAQLGGGISERDLARSKKKLEEKSKLYASMKRGDFNDDNGEGLVDFDRKWAEHPSDESEDEDARGEKDLEDDELIEYEDEFGRTRKAKKSVVEREKRREAVAQKAAEEVAALNAVPEGLILGNTIQTAAFTTATFSAVPTSSMLSSALPPEEDPADLETHYDASKEVRTKGVGFYQFSKGAKERAVEMEELEAERQRTAQERERVAEKKRKRKEELQKKREEVKRMRREKVGDKWLEGFMGDLLEGVPSPDKSQKEED